MLYFPSVQSLREMLIMIFLSHFHRQGSYLTMLYPRERCLQITFPNNGSILVFFARHVLGCHYNDVEAPQGIRLRVSLKGVFATNKIMQYLVVFSLSLFMRTLGPETISTQILKNLSNKRDMSMSVSNNLYLWVNEVENL